MVSRHLAHPSRRPPAEHTRKAFAALRASVESSGRPLIFDSYCGTGMSTALLAALYPRHLVIGIDQSGHRLARHERGAAENYQLVRAECGDFWRLALDSGWQLERHFLLYPNPWPKRGQLQKRVHGSADFPALLALGGQLELRSNWQLYVEEFGLGLHLAGFPATISQIPASQLTAGTALTLFERKYRESGHPLWSCECRLGTPRP
jgi:tRNA G46 methylase TrmB